jgi:hypothetical protein
MMKLFLGPLLLALAGCSSVATGTGKLAAGTVSVAGKVAAKTVTTSGQVAASTAQTVVRTTGSTVTAIAKSGLVTFKDAASGVNKQIPYVEGLKLYAASKTAQVDLAVRAFQILRGTQIIRGQVSPGNRSADLTLQPGDVVELGQRIGVRAGKS